MIYEGGKGVYCYCVLGVFNSLLSVIVEIFLYCYLLWLDQRSVMRKFDFSVICFCQNLGSKMLLPLKINSLFCCYCDPPCAPHLYCGSYEEPLDSPYELFVRGALGLAVRIVRTGSHLLFSSSCVYDFRSLIIDLSFTFFLLTFKNM